MRFLKWQPSHTSMIFTENKSGQCLSNAFAAFMGGDVEAAIRCLNITFNHSTNNDWSYDDTMRILQYLFWLYFYEGRYDKAASMLERAMESCKIGVQTDSSHQRYLPHLHYNLAECYLRAGQIDLCKNNFLIALDLISKALGRESKSFRLVRRRFLTVGNVGDAFAKPVHSHGQRLYEFDNQVDGNIQFTSLHSSSQRRFDLAVV